MNLKNIKIWITIAVLALSLTLCFFLFEPVFVWGAGWQKLPRASAGIETKLVSVTEHLPEVEECQKLLSAFHTASGSPAVSIAVGLENRVVWAEARGYSDLEEMTLADTETQFRIGSVSKAITSTGLGVLLEDAKIGLDDQVERYVSYFGHPEVTIRQLASHTSGIRNYGMCLCFPVWEYYNTRQFNAVRASVGEFADDPLLFEPGTSFSYSSFNYTLLSGVMEKASGESFLEFMQEAVFGPLGMARTSADYADSLMVNRATFYEILAGEYKEVYPVNNSNKWAGGGFLSTPTDLVKLGNSLLNGGILRRETIDTLFTPQRILSGEVNPQNYAIGWRRDAMDIFEGKKQVLVVHHGGVALGSTALLALFPEYNLSVAMVMNKNTASFPLFEYVMPIAEQFIGINPKSCREPGFGNISRE